MSQYLLTHQLRLAVIPYNKSDLTQNTTGFAPVILLRPVHVCTHNQERLVFQESN